MRISYIPVFIRLIEKHWAKNNKKRKSEGKKSLKEDIFAWLKIDIKLSTIYSYYILVYSVTILYNVFLYENACLLSRCHCCHCCHYWIYHKILKLKEKWKFVRSVFLPFLPALLYNTLLINCIIFSLKYNWKAFVVVRFVLL